MVEYQVFGNYGYEIIWLKVGQFVYIVFNLFFELIVFIFIFLNLWLDGNSLFVVVILFFVDMNGVLEIVGMLDLIGYELILDEDIEIMYIVNCISDNSLVDFLFFLIFISGMDYSYIQGYFGKFDVSLFGDFLEFVFLDNWEVGEFEFFELVISLMFYNIMGIFLELWLDIFDLYIYWIGIVVLDNFLFNSGLLFVFFFVDEVGEVRFMMFCLDVENFNIVFVIFGVFYQLDYVFSVVANFYENNFIINYFMDFVKVGIDVEVDILLYV